MTKGINNKVPLSLQIIIWSQIDKIVASKISVDYLQVFTFEKRENKLVLIHHQEEPIYRNEIQFEMKDEFQNLVNTKIYVIDDLTHCTMLFASEY